MTLPKKEADFKIIFALTLVHFIGDFYNAFVIPLLPIFITKFSLTLAQAGLIAGLSRFLAFVVQPPIGYLADRYSTRLFVLCGPLLVIVFISLSGIAPLFWLLLVFVCLGSIGSSMFHPAVAGMVGTYSGRHFGFNMSIFNMGGTLAFGAGPLCIAWVVENFGLAATPWTMLPGLTAMVYLYLAVPIPEVESFENKSMLGSIKEIFGPVWKPVILVWLVMVIRAFVSQSFLTYMPVLYSSEGYSLVSIGTMVSFFTVAGAVSGLLAGHLSKWVYSGAFFTGFFVLAAIPLGVAMVQKLAPRGRSMASSLMTGLAYGLGGLLTPLTGMLSDLFSIRTVLGVLALIPLFTVGMILFLPKDK
ncbi:MAG: MFS transporter [Desulfobacterales bacterium]